MMRPARLVLLFFLAGASCAEQCCWLLLPQMLRDKANELEIKVDKEVRLGLQVSFCSLPSPKA